MLTVNEQHVTSRLHEMPEECGTGREVYGGEGGSGNEPGDTEQDESVGMVQTSGEEEETRRGAAITILTAPSE